MLRIQITQIDHESVGSRPVLGLRLMDIVQNETAPEPSSTLVPPTTNIAPGTSGPGAGQPNPAQLSVALHD